MEKGRRLFNTIKAILLTVLFCTAVYFENAQRQRLFVLVLIFALYMSVGFGRGLIQHRSNLYCLSFILDMALVYILEYNSRLLINYFFHSFYIVILLESSLLLGLRRGMAVGAATVLVSLIKYIYLIYYKFNLSNVSQLAFFLMVNVLILVVSGFAQHNKEERERKDMLYKELLDTHKRLKQYTDEVNRLSVVEERNRIARDIHDTLGHNMTALIMQLQMAEHLLKEDSNKAGELLASSVKTARDSMAEIREVVETLRGAGTALAPAESIRKLISEFSARTGAEIKLEITGESDIQDSAANIAVYRIIQEAMTNSVRHGKATMISVQLDYTKEAVTFCIADNGIGAEAIKEGYGLKGIRERAEAFGGNVEIGSRDGFYIKGLLHML
ncbi:MAG: sensor histidine kinase [Clostridiaceae bacterium]|nr:sensor histidine kinase [Clostridiaceae bacterium]